MDDHDAIVHRLLEVERAFRVIKRDVGKLTIPEIRAGLGASGCSADGDDLILCDRLLRVRMRQNIPRGYSIPWYEWDEVVHRGRVSVEPRDLQLPHSDTSASHEELIQLADQSPIGDGGAQRSASASLLDAPIPSTRARTNKSAPAPLLRDEQGIDGERIVDVVYEVGALGGDVSAPGINVPVQTTVTMSTARPIVTVAATTTVTTATWSVPLLLASTCSRRGRLHRKKPISGITLLG